MKDEGNIRSIWSVHQYLEDELYNGRVREIIHS